MAKKKQEQSKKVSENISLSYSGEVTVSISKGNKIYSTQKFKNNGRQPLFNFFANCLAGLLSESSNDRPKYVEFFNIGTFGSPVPSASFIELATSQNVKTVNPVINTGSVDVNSSDTEASTTFHFLVPMVNFDYTSPINMIAIYSETNKPIRGGSSSTDYSKASAYIIITTTNSSQETVLGQLITPERQLSQSADAKNVLIQWKMTLKN